ncbi:hypothetical protein BDR26DRAFT_921361 [Obelidium mucronatum]|nr:hypothetical protein BDR26DRAFT_921361 [Obelidium mucronatum]
MISEIAQTRLFTAKHELKSRTSHLATVLASLHSLFSSKQLSDISIKAFGETFYFHRAILLSNSYFSSLFNGPWSDNNKDVVELTFDDPNITLDAITVVFERIYAINYNEITEDSVRALLATACFFDDQNLCNDCVLFIEQHTTTSNVSSLLNFAENYSYGQYSIDIIKSCLIFLCRNAVASPICLNNLDEKYLITVLGSKYLVIENERKRYNFIVKLILEEVLNNPCEESDIKKAPTKHERLAVILSTCVIFSQMSTTDLVEIRNQNIVAEDILMKAQWRRALLSSAICSVSTNSTSIKVLEIAPFDKSILSTPISNTYDFEEHRMTAKVPKGYFCTRSPAKACPIESFFYGGSFWSLSLRLINNTVRPILKRAVCNDAWKYAGKMDSFIDERPIISVRFQIFLFKGNEMLIDSGAVYGVFQQGAAMYGGAVHRSEVFGEDENQLENTQEMMIGCNIILK